VAEPLHVYLWSISRPMIIVPAPTGIVYCNQTDGVATVDRELEGWLLPIPTPDADVFRPRWWEKHHNHRIAGDEDTWRGICARIEAACRAPSSGAEGPIDLTVVDHPDNCEAWVHVSFSFADLGPPNGNQHLLVPMRGVLTWENCD